MAIKDIIQPEIITIEDNIRLRKYDGNYMVAVSWYQDEYVYYNSEGITDKNKIPDENYVQGMYEYLDSVGECYFIEVKEKDEFIPIGDITLKEENPPIVIGLEKYRGHGIGKKAFIAILARAKAIGIRKIHDSVIFDYNIASQKMHEALGSKKVAEKDNEFIYELDLMEEL